MRYCVTHNVQLVERLMCCEVEFFWEVCFREGTAKLFYCVVSARSPRVAVRLLISRVFFFVKLLRFKRPAYSSTSGRIMRQYAPALTATSSRSIAA